MSIDRPWLDSYPEEVPNDLDLPEIPLSDHFDNAFEKFSDRTALIFEGREIKYNHLQEETDKFAAALSELGIEKGDVVGLLVPNSPQFIIAYIGIIKAGAIVTPISPMYSSREIEHQLKDSDASSIVVMDSLFKKLRMTDYELENIIATNIGEYLPTHKRILGKIFGSIYKKLKIPSPDLPEHVLEFQNLLENSQSTPLELDINPKEDVAVIAYTGGTTGLPKGAMITHFNITSFSKIYKHFKYYREEGKEVIAGYMPLDHLFGQGSLIFGGLCLGQKIILFTTPDLDDILDAMRKYKVTSFSGAPTVYEMLKDHRKTERVEWKDLKEIVSGADALHEGTREDWKEMTGTEIIEDYGLTESTALLTANLPGYAKEGSLGFPVLCTDVTIADLEEKEFMPPGEVGEIIARGPQIIKGFWNNPEANEENFVELDGKEWLRTGDLGWMDEDGYFYFKDRKKDYIVYKGYSIYTTEVEDVLTSHTKVRSAAVIGVPREEVGEIPKAFAVLETDARGELSEDDIIDYCEENLAHYKVPQMVEFLGEIPKTDAGKVSRKELREMYLEE